MTEDLMRYDLMVEGALRTVVKQAMTRIAAEGLPGDHHLYISFHTADPDVEIPSYLRERYPDDMTIVLQHQFERLDVTEDGFAVSLNFNNVQERLRIPFGSITSFADPSANFGLQFKFDEADHAEPGEAADAAPAVGNAPDAAADDAESPSDDKVIALDTFRKK